MKRISIVTLILLAINLCSCKTDPSLFTTIPKKDSGLDFTNQITENDTLNILDNEFVYNGAGVALGDLNGDGWDDIFLSGNQVDNALYLNTKKLTFKNVSKQAHILKPNSHLWSSGVNIVDINLDGRLDIYVCNTIYKAAKDRKNLLYINQGNDADGIPVFKEMAEEYGIADDSYSSHAQFFDYDNDGDLDLFIGVNRIEGIDPGKYRSLSDNASAMSRDHLYENRWDNNLNHPVFTNVSADAGIAYNGFSHSTLIYDFNQDGWLDIYVANDYLTSDLVYINNHNGTFSNMAGEIFKHFSLASMGSDLGDINHDGRMDLFTSEMQPYYNKRKKLFQGPSSYQREVLTKKYDYEYQYTRNTLQLNLGTNPENNLPIYADLGMQMGVQETDWSWASLFVDFDNDSWQDLLVVNGFPKDVTDRDFANFRMRASRLVSKSTLLQAIPPVKMPNFFFRNKGDLTFEDATKDWGVNFNTFSNGAAYGDLDKDGDLDLVINNIDDPVLLLENKASQKRKDNHYLRIQLKGPNKNPDAFGTQVTVYSNGTKQTQALISGRGYLSKSENTLHFGLGSQTMVDSITIQWPGNKIQKLYKEKADQTLSISYAKEQTVPFSPSTKINPNFFKEIQDSLNLAYEDCEVDFIDFSFQRTLPHKFSQYGPSLAVGDINGDGLDDMLAGASRSYKERWFIQKPDGTFIQKEQALKSNANLEEEDAGTLLFDADGDGDLDLYMVRGSGQYAPESENYRDQLYLNNGQGNFSLSQGLPNIVANGSCVKAADMDRDGDLDLFVGARVLPMTYPLPDRSYILQNNSGSGQVAFTDATGAIAKELEKPGMVNDALWTDFNGDFWPDLILATEWGPIRFFENHNGKLEEITAQSGIQDQVGWWTSLAAADLDNDGDMDYVAGNYGTNLYFKGTDEEPLTLYAKDIDNNGVMDPLISYYMRDSIGVKREYLYHPLQDVSKEFNNIKQRYNSFGEFGSATAPDMLKGIMDDAIVKKANWMQTSWIENLGDGKFAVHALPNAVQTAPIFGILAEDIDQNGTTDLLMVGNDYGVEVQQGRADALVGAVLLNKGKGTFTAQDLDDTHFFVPGNAKSLVSLTLGNNDMALVASQNNGPLKVFETQKSNSIKPIKLSNQEVKCEELGANGKKTVKEFYWGSGFQSQSGRWVRPGPDAKTILFYDNTGKQTRKITL